MPITTLSELLELSSDLENNKITPELALLKSYGISLDFYDSMSSIKAISMSNRYPRESKEFSAFRSLSTYLDLNEKLQILIDEIVLYTDRVNLFTSKSTVSIDKDTSTSSQVEYYMDDVFSSTDSSTDSDEDSEPLIDIPESLDNALKDYIDFAKGLFTTDEDSKYTQISLTEIIANASTQILDASAIMHSEADESLNTDSLSKKNLLPLLEKITDAAQLKAKIAEWYKFLFDNYILESNLECILEGKDRLVTEAVTFIDNVLESTQSESISEPDLTTLANYFNQLPTAAFTKIQDDLLVIQSSPQEITAINELSAIHLTTDIGQTNTADARPASTDEALAQNATILSPATDAPHPVQSTPMLVTEEHSGSQVSSTPFATAATEELAASTPIPKAVISASSKRLDQLLEQVRIDLGRLENIVKDNDPKKTLFISSAITQDKINKMKTFLLQINHLRSRYNPEDQSTARFSDNNLLTTFLSTINSNGAGYDSVMKNGTKVDQLFAVFWHSIKQERNQLTRYTIGLFHKTECADNLIKLTGVNDGPIIPSSRM